MCLFSYIFLLIRVCIYRVKQGPIFYIKDHNKFLIKRVKTFLPRKSEKKISGIDIFTKKLFHNRKLKTVFALPQCKIGLNAIKYQAFYMVICGLRASNVA